MLKMLARLYLIMMVTYGVALYTAPSIVLQLFDERSVTYNLEQARGTLKLVQQRFEQTPKASWAALEQALKTDFTPIEISVIAADSPQLTDKERAELANGRNAVRLGYYGELGTAFTPLSGDKVLRLGFPDPPFDINIIYWLMNILVGAALLACLLLWVRPHWKDLQRLKHTAMRLGQGHLAERTQISPRSNIGELAQVFDRMAQDIEELLSQQQELLNAVSHELRTPLSRLEFGMALMQADNLEAPTRLRLEQMVGHVRELDTLIDELLSYTRLRSPYQRADRQQVPVAAYLDSVLGGFIDEQESKGFELSVDIERAPERCTLDPRLTARAVQNLIGNAIRYCEKQVRVSAEQRGKALTLRVEDDGVGIPESEQARIFEPFYRMDRSRDRITGGYGLGLAISRGAIECQGGTLTVGRSALGGACFEIVLPDS